MSEISKNEQPEGEPRVEIKEYSDEYKDQVKDLIFDVYENEMNWHNKNGRPDLDKIKEIYTREKNNFWVAVDGEKVIGTIALLDEGEKRASLHRFCVEEDFRGEENGVSSELFSTLLKFAREEGFLKIFLSTDETAVGANKFYIKNGFKRIESLPKDMTSRLYNQEDVFYEMDIKKASEEK